MLADPVEVTALLWWLAATRSQREEEEEESPSWGGQAPHRAGAQQGTEGWTGRCCIQRSKAGHGASVTVQEMEREQKKTIFTVRVANTCTGCPERLWSLCP